MWKWALVLLWTAWGLQALLCAFGTHRFRRRLRLGRQGDDPPYEPRATVIVPFRGVDVDLSACVRSLCTQSYGPYRLVLVVDDRADPAYPLLRREVASYPDRQTDILVAGPAGPAEGQKVHNQLHALRAIEPEAEDDEVWVFADSDAVPGPQWLAAMVRPLQRTRSNGATTGYRWLVPVSDGRSVSIWSKLASVINSSVTCFLWRKRTVHAWGGSMAVRVGTARRGKLIERLTGAVTDDYPVTRMCRDLGLSVSFVPAALVPTPVAFDRRSLLNFGYRQYLITRIYAPHLFAIGIAALSLWCTAFAAAWVTLALSAAARSTGTDLIGRPAADSPVGGVPLEALALVAVVTVFAFNQVRATVRSRIVSEVFRPSVVEALGRTLKWDRWATPLWMGLHWCLVLGALIGRTMVWRGLRYRLRGPNRVERIGEG